MGRHQGRITKEDIREAGFRRWDGGQRITTDWLNVLQDPELCWPNGDCLVYLREPRQSSRGPAFRIHTSRLRTKGFRGLLDRCITTPVLHTSPECTLKSCTGCDSYLPTKELYLPSPPRSTLEDTFEHYVSTRNFFAWLYDIPLAGQALGKSLVDLLNRVDSYRPEDRERNRMEVIVYAESQKYLDFRECVDHALAILHFAEHLQLDNLWIDAFAHCVGLSHRGLRESIEYEHVSEKSKLLINEERLDLDLKLSRVGGSIANFFEDELSSSHWGLHQAARDHLDRFRSFLHSYYIEQHGFWPPDKFDQEVMQRLVCNAMYSDFRCLYHHLADPKSSNLETEPDISGSGGVCALQNVRSFDARLRNDPLPQPLPQLPCEANVGFVRTLGERRNSWNPLMKRRFEKEQRNARRMQALVDSTNRDWDLMSCVLVRRFSQFEVSTAIDDLETISLADGRKVRWIAVYAILQLLISVMQAPRQVRNTEALSYSLCCKAPELLPWQDISSNVSDAGSKTGIRPDTFYSHTNTHPEAPVTSREVGSKQRRETFDTMPMRRSLVRSSSSFRSTSLRRLVSLKTETICEDVSRKRGSFCEIYVPGYGNGLNEVEIEMTTSPIDDTVPKLPGSTSVSRESSNASSNSTWSKTSTESGSEVETPETSSSDITQATVKLGLTGGKSEPSISKVGGAVRIIAAEEGLETVHFNSRTWDGVLGT